MRVLAAALLVGCTAGPAPSAPPPDAYVIPDAPARVGAGPGGGHLDQLVFAVVGDARPVNIDDTAGYPTAIVGQIFDDIAADPAQPRFAITTGDYMFASVTGQQVDPQLDAYLGARAHYPGVVYPAMGNHECNGYTASNCGPGSQDGEPANYAEFLTRMIAPLQEAVPYYVERFAATDGSWTAKLIVIAANAWNDTQAAWLTQRLAEPTTYTIIVRHEPADAETAPGVGPSTIALASSQVTLLVTGHTHTYQHIKQYREIIVGNGGAPLTSDVNYGYVIVQRQADGTLLVTAKDYQSLAVIDQFAVNPDGTVH